MQPLLNSGDLYKSKDAIQTRLANDYDTNEVVASIT